MSDYLPPKAVTEILCRLPVKKAVQCTTLNKYFYSFIKSPAFIAAHLERSKSNRCRNPLLLLQFAKGQMTFSGLQYALHSDNPRLDEVMKVHFPFEGYCFEVIGCCNGLVCLGRHSGLSRTFLWNPLMGKSIVIGDPGCRDCLKGTVVNFKSGIAYDASSDDIKVLNIQYDGPVGNLFPRNPQNVVHVYSLKSGAWKRITSPRPKFLQIGVFSMAFANGSLHCIIDRIQKGVEGFRSEVLAFDSSAEVFTEIKLPECLSNVTACYMSIHAYQSQSSIAVAKFDESEKHCTNVWVMKEYGVVDSWTQILTVGEGFYIYRVLGFRRNGEIMCEKKGGGIITWHPESKKLNLLKIMGEKKHIEDIDYFEESLLLLDKKGYIKSDDDSEEREILEILKQRSK